MYRIDNATAISPIPAPAAVGPNPNSFFTKGNPAISLPATIVDDDFLNAMQEEICAVIEGSGQTLSKTVRNQLFQALTGGRLARTRLTANTTFYVATTGNDSNTGLAVGTPWLTIQHAVNVIQLNYDLSGFVVTIQVADGTYTAGATVAGFCVGQISQASLVINGNSVTPSNVIVNGTTNVFVSVNGAAVTVQNLKPTASSGAFGSAPIIAAVGAVMNVSGLVLGAQGYCHILGVTNGIVNVVGNCTVSGGGSICLFSSEGGEVSTNSGVTITLTGTPAFSISFANAQRLSRIISACTFSGAATGVRYSVTQNGLIDTAGAGANYFPGNSAGLTSAGGQYT